MNSNSGNSKLGKLGNAKPGTPADQAALPSTVGKDPVAKDRDEPGPGDLEKLDHDELENFETEAMRERDA